MHQRDETSTHSCHQMRNIGLKITIRKSVIHSAREDLNVVSLFYQNDISVVSRAILQPVYQFGTPNSYYQTLKSVDFWCKLLSLLVVAEPQEQCFELIRMQTCQNFLWLYLWTPIEEGLQYPQNCPAAQQFFFLLHSWKNWHPKKLAFKNTFSASRWTVSFTILDIYHPIKTLLKCKENKELLAMYSGVRHFLSQEYWY